MTFLMFCNLVPLKTGAFERFLELLGAEAKAAGGRFVVALAGEPIGPVAEAWRESGTEWVVVPGWQNDAGGANAWRFVPPALRLLRRFKPDVAAVHFGNELPSLAAALLAPFCGAGGTGWVWEQDQQIADPSILTARISRLRLLAIRFDRFLAVYEGGRRSMILRRVPGTRIRLIHNAVGPHAPTRARGWLRGELNIPPGAPLILTVGSLIERKRIAFLVEIMARLGANGTVVHLAAVGEGPERENLLRLAADRGLSARLHLVGLRSDVREIMADADIYVHASAAETCTYAVTESMAAGIPAVVTEAGAAREQIEDGVTGYVLPPNDGAGFEARLRELLGNEPRRKAMGEAARERWKCRFRVEDQARAYHRMYRELAGAIA